MLSTATSHKNNGIAIHLNEFLSFASLSNSVKQIGSYSSSAFCQARQKVSWVAFEDMFKKAVNVANVLLPNPAKHFWHNMSVIAFDGSKYTLPHSKDIVAKFDPKAGLGNSGKGHYPQCIVMTAYDVLKEMPIDIRIAPVDTSERCMAMAMTSSLPQNCIIVEDRGFPSYKYQQYLHDNFDGHYLIRCPAKQSFPSVISFVATGKAEEIIEIAPTKKHQERISAEERLLSKPLTVRALRVEHKDGSISVLLTTLLDFNKFKYHEIIDLYYKRWAIEVHYRNDKCLIETEKFHTKKANGIQQEIFAAATVSVIARILVILMEGVGKAAPQFKNAVVSFARYSVIFVSKHINVALELFSQMINDIQSVRYYRHKMKRPPQPRICKKPLNQWCNRNRNVACSNP